MAKQIFLNLPVKDLEKSIHFFRQLGYEFNSQFTDDKAACMVISDTIYAMLLVEDFFKTFTPKAVCDTTKNTEALFALSCESRQEVDEMVRKAIAAGGRVYSEPKDHGFMYQHGFEDLDGHLWEILYMDPDFDQKQ